MSAISISGSQDEVADSLIPCIMAKIEPTEDGSQPQWSSSGPAPSAESAAVSPNPADIARPPTPQAAAEVPAATLPTSNNAELDPNAGNATAAPATSPSRPENIEEPFSTAFPQLSPPLEPVRERFVEDLRPLSDDDDDDEDLPTLQSLIAETRPDYNSQNKKSQERTPRSSGSPLVKSEPISNINPAREAATPSPTHSVIDLSGSSPPKPPKIQTGTRSPSLSASSASTAHPKRKLSSLPPSSLESPSPKRSRTLTPAHKHDVHWALDGSIVIQIQDTKFKLHQSHLAKHSPWFSGLFDGQTVDHQKSVELAEDDSTPMYILAIPSLTAKDFTRLLDAFDKAILYVHKDPSFTRTASILRVATLLSFNDFRDWAIRNLEDEWSPALEDLSPVSTPHATETVTLARTCGVPTILKRAMYELVRLAGYGQTDKEEGVTAADFRALVRAREQLTVEWMQITSPYSPDLMNCASARATAIAPPVADQAAAAPPVPAPPPAAAVKCTTTDPLQSGKTHHKLVRESGIADDFLYDPLCGLQALIEANWEGEAYCEACLNLRREMWTNKRERLWDNLDIWFGLN
ncbi:hypothetical protein B0H16DRAFT_1431624 [Mycena metata]|uniref:BTB domain-containing protein n=1 Tax=Mycena metata TaxID=1033252 RepID=A0AAD7HJS9_9AGAR|nr:hypothetical protein B0H16DRAFT_1431624 [Mycena metata]